MELTARVRTARTAPPTAMAIALAAAALSLTVTPGASASAQERANAQAEQSRALRDQRQETWVLRPSPAPRGDVVYRNDAGQQVLRVTPNGGITVYTARTPGGAPASYSGPGQNLSPPLLGPAQLLNLMLRRSALVSQALGRMVEINADTGVESESLTVEALILSTDAVVRIARSPSARSSLSELRRIVITEGPAASATYARGQLRIVVAPSQGVAGRPSSERVIRAFLPQESASR